jgi:hypothetical protein
MYEGKRPVERPSTTNGEESIIQYYDKKYCLQMVSFACIYRAGARHNATEQL